jgi:cytochrome P450
MAISEPASTAKRPPDWQPASHEITGSNGGGGRGVERTAEYARLRSECPVAWSDDWGGYWTLTRYDDVKWAALKHKELENGRAFIQLPDISDVNPVIPIGINPPEHAIYRRALNKYFSRDVIATLEPRLRSLVNQTLDQILEQGSADAVWELCGPTAAQGLAALLHQPDDEWHKFIDDLRAMEMLRTAELEGLPPDRDGLSPERFFQIQAQHMARLVAERRREPLDPETDLISGILAMEVDGKPLPEATVIQIGVTVLGAGFQTVQDGIAGGLYLLAVNPGDQAHLRREPELVASAVEEFLRLDPPTHENVRRATQDVELHGRTIESGEYVALSFAAANRDESAFEHPDACIIDRSPNQHLSFGHGFHKCVGAPLARLEMRVTIEELLRRTRSFVLDGRPEPRQATQHGGLARLPLRFNLP